MVGQNLWSAVIAAATVLSQCVNAGRLISDPGVSYRLSKSSQNANSIATTGEATVPVLKVVPKAYIVELKSGARSLEGRSEGLHAQFHKRAKEENVDYKIRVQFNDPSLFHGLSINLSDDHDKERLESLPEVAKIWPVLEIPRPNLAAVQASTELKTGVANVTKDGYSTDVIRGKDYKLDYNLKMAGVDHLHSRGFKGKGIKIAVIDDGVDYDHPALGGGFGPGKKIAFGSSYVDDEFGGPNDPYSCPTAGHGTLVSGVIGGQDPEDSGFGLLGVAPEATLGVYRVLPCGGGGSFDDVMRAMTEAYDEGASVLSISLAAPNGFEAADPFNQIVTNLRKRGVATVIAAGNEAAYGPMLMGSPAIAKDAIAVASADGAKFPTTYKMKGNNGGQWRYSSLWPLEGDFPIYASPNYDDSFGCGDSVLKAAATVEKNGWNIGDTFYMVRQGFRCATNTVIFAARDAGFKDVIIWRDQVFSNPSDNNYQGWLPFRRALSLDHVDGPDLYKAVTNDPLKFRAKFSDRRFLPVETTSAGLTANYSTMGNSWEFNVFKPLMAAPGSFILSTWTQEYGGYAIASGTSLATPFVAGCYALLQSAFPEMSIDEITNLLTSTAKPAQYWGDDKITHSVSQQGAGGINIWDAYNSGVKFEDGVVLAGESSKPVTRNVTFTNTLGRSKTFEITHVAAGLMQAVPYADIDPVAYNKFGFPSKPIYAKVDFKTPTKVTLEPMEKTTVEFIITPPSGLDPDTIPLYSGYIRFTSGRDAYSVPYQGLPYVVNEVPALERDLLPGHVQLPVMAKVDPESGAVTYIEKDLVPYNPTAGSYPSMAYFTRQPIYAYRVDLVAPNITFEPTYYGYDKLNEIKTTTPDLPVVDNFGDVPSFGTLFFQEFLPPTYGILSWEGALTNADGSDNNAPDGDYRFLLRVLLIEKDASSADSWESWLGPVLRIAK